MRGGKREGSGRKRLDLVKKSVTLKLAPDVVEYLKQNRPASKTVEDAVRLYADRIKSMTPSID